MTRANRRLTRVSLPIVALVLVPFLPALAFQIRPEPSRFDHLVIYDPSETAGAASLPVESLPEADPLRQAWESFRSAYGSSWRVVLDRRSGAPLLVEGVGIPWIAGAGNRLKDSDPASLESLEASLRKFLSENRGLLRAEDAELTLDRHASGQMTPEVWQIVFGRQFHGVPVAGERYLFTIGHGNLVSFGATRWSAIATDPTPSIDASEALRRLYGYMGLTGVEGIDIVEGAKLIILMKTAGGTGDGGPYDGSVGTGYSSALAWRYALRVAGEPGTWVGLIDAHSGAVLGLYDDNRYAQVKGGIYPTSDDQICPSGCEQPNYPMPFADVTVNGGPVTANTMGLFDCTPGGSTATTTLAGSYVMVHDNCGSISESVTCDNDLDLRTSGGIDCTVPSGSSAGNTHASRTGFYHLNRIAEHGRAWLPSNVWLTQQLTDNVNINATCNAYWNGVSVNFYKSGGGCNNTGEIAGVFLHEWGHGLDNNDGGGYDNPTEAYADISAVMNTHVSCVGRGFFQSGNCGGYGNPCLNCTGIRDQDWDQRANHTPSTPGGFVQSDCGGGDSPCGREGHCESYVAGETMWDLANRDLPPAGLDQNTAWQLTDKLWYKSRNGSGGNAYNCSLPNSDGCGSNSWFTKFRNIDDDDGNLNNGTPHAAAIFAAFNRHGIACGAAGDPSNQNTSSCPSIGAPSLSATAGSGSVSLSWTAVPNAVSYNVLRNDVGCSSAHTIIASVAAPGTTYTDTGLANGFTEHYAVQAVGSNSACDGPLSNCVAASPQPYAGSISLDRGAYACSVVMTVTVRDANIGSSTTTVQLTSTSEPTPEVLTLTETDPGNSAYTGTIVTDPGPVAHDGKLQVKNGDVITATYHDADNGSGNRAVVFTTARVDCAGPNVSAVSVADLPPGRVQITWTTDENSTSRIDYGPTGSLGSFVSDGALVTSHSFFLSALNFCGTYFFNITSTDAQGNTTVADRGGLHYSFETGDVPGRVFFDNYETTSGWSLNGEWQIDLPQGKGNPSGHDPSSAWSGKKVLGLDLTGLGANPGDYEPNTNTSALSPLLDLTNLHNGVLKIRRWLNVGRSPDLARISVVHNSVSTPIWGSPNGGQFETDWTYQSYDISQAADGKNNVQIVFLLGSNAVDQYGGWNIDDILIKDGSQPDTKFCGGCTNKPSFGGLTSAADVSGCADTGVALSWQTAASWGSSGSGTYAVYRDTTPNFVPSASNRLAKGLTGISYTDSAAPNNVTLYYLVRAENNETCSNGPNNSGVQDDNTVYLSARDELSQPVPADVSPSLRGARVTDTNVRLSWAAASGAVSYNVTRADNPQMAGSRLLGSTGALVFEDIGEATGPTSRYYLVKGVNSCGTEGP